MSAYNPFYETANRPLGKPSVRFSKTEIQHLTLAVLALTFGFSLVGTGLSMGERFARLFVQPEIILASFLAVSSGFVFHELAHKFVAIRFGCLAEFRAQMSGLGFSMLIAAVSGFFFAAPGAVQIYGRVDLRENGLISVAGPATNMAISLATLPFIPFTTGITQHVFLTVSIVNAILGAFNLLPFGPLDGKKVMAWNKGIWGGALAGSILLFIAASIAPTLLI